MREYYGMPICQVQNVALALNDRDKERGTEVVGIEKLGELSSPICEGF